MHILLMGYLFVIGMVAVTSSSLTGGVLVFLLLGVLPSALLLWLMRRKPVK